MGFLWAGGLRAAGGTGGRRAARAGGARRAAWCVIAWSATPPRPKSHRTRASTTRGRRDPTTPVCPDHGGEAPRRRVRRGVAWCDIAWSATAPRPMSHKTRAPTSRGRRAPTKPVCPDHAGGARRRDCRLRGRQQPRGRRAIRHELPRPAAGEPRPRQCAPTTAAGPGVA
jgi:hypothetical protein